jgi:hypothetical protein
MKKLVAIALLLTLSGCGMFTKFLPAKPQFPEPVKELTEPCPDLKQLEGDKVAITDLLKKIVENYTLYYQCSLKNDGWNEWYQKQKKIYEDTK